MFSLPHNPSVYLFCLICLCHKCTPMVVKSGISCDSLSDNRSNIANEGDPSHVITTLENTGCQNASIVGMPADNRSEDGYLQFNQVFHPPEDFCMNPNNETRSPKLCYNAGTFTVKKCCPHNQIWSIEDQKCRKAFSLYRPKTTDFNTHLPFSVVPVYQFHNQTDAANYDPEHDGSSQHSSYPVNCPQGFIVKVFTPGPCSRFRITQSGIEYETTTGLFHRKSDMNRLAHDHYCVDGHFTNPLCYLINRTDNKNIRDKCIQDFAQVLMLCEAAGGSVQAEQSPAKAYCLASIWLSTCPLLLLASATKIFTGRRNVHAHSLSCYLFLMFLVNVNSAVLILEKPSLGCKLTDFSMKYFYMSTLCWLTSINFGLWRTFRANLPKSAESRQFLFNFMFSMIVPGVIVAISYFGALNRECDSQYCALYSHKTIPYYNFPVIFFVLLNLALFIRTYMTIAGLRKETGSVLRKELTSARGNIESFRLFTKLFLMTGPIWVIRLVLFYLQVSGTYFSWVGVGLETIFSIPEAVFSLMVLSQNDTKKWMWQNHPSVARKITRCFPCFYCNVHDTIELHITSSHTSRTSPTVLR